ncbi:alpha/beta fold hydrolase [Tenggerimyces flavus]|uniref:Alpha/beta fold hydrolase n=1 Tax=Tenggerimyces flavus TaxID=1708749 RepID=A0ABV7YNB0_9ACTN|nr:alpha/beta hydrolase [Tenggerimyces flavus]MBM7784842.1 pimeloyl-ACP methyl ester carboxylesterase [Tenggerimyces flavus]
MSDYVTVNGVRTWYSASGEGPPLVLLHGGFSHSHDFGMLLGSLTPAFRVLTPDRRGHGRTPDVPGPVTPEDLVADVVSFISTVVGGPVLLAGYSAGGVVAQLVALARPDLVSRLALISTAFETSGWIFLPDPSGEMPAVVVDAYAEVSPDGRDHFPVVLEKFAKLAQTSARVEVERIGCPTLVVAADDDLVRLDHSVALYEALPAGQLAILPGTSHLVLFEKPDLLAGLLTSFLTEDPAPMMPIRRAQPAG